MFRSNLYRDCRGSDKMISVYWFAILLIVAIAISVMVFIFYGKPFNIKTVEAKLLGNQVANCFSEGGYLKEGILSSLTEENFLEKCSINFDVEDFADWKERDQYFIEAKVFPFDVNLTFDVGGIPILDLSVGNSGLKPKAELTPAGTQEKDRIVIHYTATAPWTAENIAKNWVKGNINAQYLVEVDGTIIETELQGWKAKDYHIRKDPSEVTGMWEKNPAQNAGCGTQENEIAECPDECVTESGKLAESCHCGPSCCIKGFNQRGIGIEVVNLGIACRRIESCLSNRSVHVEDACWNFDESFWEKYTDAQMDSLVQLVAGIAMRNNITIDRDHIIGHEEITNNKNDPGPAFPWDKFIERVRAEAGQDVSQSQDNLEKLDLEYARSFYTLDKNGNAYVVEILTAVGKNEKNE